MKVLILSPHADDAVFSCCDHITQWIKKSHKVTVCTIFSRFTTTKISKDVKWYLNNSGYEGTIEFENARLNEDVNALSFIKANYISPDLVDGAFREENNQLNYKSFNELFSGLVSKSDSNLRKKLEKYFHSINNQYDLVISPIGIGNHADHLVTSMCAEKVFKTNKLAYYLDVPYYFFMKNWNKKIIHKIRKRTLSTKWSSNCKLEAMRLYQSQFKLIVKNNTTPFFNKYLVKFPEILFLPKLQKN